MMKKLRLLNVVLAVVCTVICIAIVMTSGLKGDDEFTIMMATLLTVAVAVFSYSLFDLIIAAMIKRHNMRVAQRLRRERRIRFRMNLAKEARKAQPGFYYLDTEGHLTSID